jgi:CTP synthase (UTP-ammonia lyase)
MNPTIGLVGECRDSVIAHRAIPRALELARAATKTRVTWEWIRTDEIDPDSNPPALKRSRVTLARFAAIWAVPATPYASMEGALAAIRFARETGRPFLGTCGGFQHALIEIARNFCGVPAADHAETNPHGAELVVIPLACSMVERTGTITFAPGSKLDAIFGGRPTIEGYHCSYGPNPAWRDRLAAAGLHFTGRDEAGEARAGELTAHPFFIGTLFQPERSALRGAAHPLVTAFVRAAAAFTLTG